MKKSLILAFALSIAWALAANAGETAKPAVSVKPPTSAVKNAKPPADAKNASSIGKGAAMAKTANTSSDTDSFWTQEIDIDGDGDIDEVDTLWDDEDKVLYLYDELDVDCAWTDGTASSSLLVALYGDGNTVEMDAGSGWWIATLDEGECAADETDVYGCSFDDSGMATECDEVDSFDDDMIVFED